MNTYKLNFEQIRQDAKLGAMLEALERGFKKFRIDFYLIGAVSRDVWMVGIKGVYEALKEYLITH